MPTRRTLISTLAALSAGSAVPRLAWTQSSFPDKPIRYVVPFAAGGLTDAMARMIARGVGESLGQPVVVDNKPGANANLGADQVAKSAADGYTWLAVTLTHAVNPALFPQISYSITQDLIPVVHLANSPLVLVIGAKNPANDLATFLASAKGKTLNGGSSGNGTPPHLGLELLALNSQLTVQHIPYKGGAPSLNDLLGGQLDFIVSNLPESIGHIQSGKLRALAITSNARHPLLPQVPTFAQAGLNGMELENWTAMMMPKHTPPDIVNKVAASAIQTLQTPAVKDRLIQMGFAPTGLGPAEFDKLLQQDIARWAQIVQQRGIRPN
ncbi:MAG: tripartite tricarboxylate transporter substrate binding protein [Pseudomonadota bacterium]|nr:tripartite tricarboxylate transporter substrate binding protein [Pseudomonadota bacterium]